MASIYVPTQADIITALTNRGYTEDQAVDAIREIKAKLRRMDKLMVEYSYTTEDFEDAFFAVSPTDDDRFTARYIKMEHSDEDDSPWINGMGKTFSHEALMEAGCIPVYVEPYSPEALERAWEHGEKPTPGEVATEGMVTITWDWSATHPKLHVNSKGERLFTSERIIYRPPAPEPEPEPDPVADLTAVLYGWHDQFRPEELAEFLHKHGVRVTDDE